MNDARTSEERTIPGEPGHLTTADRDACPVCNPSSNQEVAPRPWRLWKTGERSELPHIADANGTVVARAEGNIWLWQDFIAPVIIAAVNGASVETDGIDPGDPDEILLDFIGQYDQGAGDIYEFDRSTVLRMLRDAAGVKRSAVEPCDVICPATSPPVPHRFGAACIYCGTPKIGVERGALKTSEPFEKHPDYCMAHGGHLVDSPACKLAREREKRAEKASGPQPGDVLGTARMVYTGKLPPRKLDDEDWCMHLLKYKDCPYGCTPENGSEATKVTK